MNLRNKILNHQSFILGFIFIAQVQFVDAEENKLSSYTCKNEIDAINCSKACTAITDLKVQYKINFRKSAVMEVAYYKENQLGGETFKDCTIFDQKNWDCSYTADIPNIYFSNHKKRMINGIYSGWSDRRYSNGKFEIDEKLFCAK